VNFGILFGIGGSIGGMQTVADKSGNLGVATNINSGVIGLGASAMGDAQVSVSTSPSIYGLRGSSLSVDFSGGTGPAFDLVVSKRFNLGPDNRHGYDWA
jgi:hypothetical protein